MMKAITENQIIVERMAQLLTETIDDLKEWSEFMGVEVFKARGENLTKMEKLRTSLRFTNKRITQQEENQKGFVTWLHQEEKQTSEKTLVLEPESDHNNHNNIEQQ